MNPAPISPPSGRPSSSSKEKTVFRAMMALAASRAAHIGFDRSASRLNRFSISSSSTSPAPKGAHGASARREKAPMDRGLSRQRMSASSGCVSSGFCGRPLQPEANETRGRGSRRDASGLLGGPGPHSRSKGASHRTGVGSLLALFYLTCSIDTAENALSPRREGQRRVLRASIPLRPPNDKKMRPEVNCFLSAPCKGACFSKLRERAAVLRQALCVCKCFARVRWRSVSYPGVNFVGEQAELCFRGLSANQRRLSKILLSCTVILPAFDISKRHKG